MAGRKHQSDSPVNAARYVVDRLTREGGDEPEPEPEPTNDGDAGQSMMEARAQYVELTIQQAMRRGDFDDLPGAGKPLDLGRPGDPDWWIRRKIERERLTGLGPPALTLRTEHAELEAKLDATGSERRVRELLEDFNARVVEARRQLQGGPPVVTPTRDVEDEVARWRERRAARLRESHEAREREQAERATLTWRERRRAKRRR
ncbi:DUF1992 domain-containing protein [Leifsonia sp. NPDC058292]|uniref:DnaJ family domain-containing protein n=1 Tax=Leifsonia sp. NPDC058292 TaxID=3346428 RepID=UPI0036DF815A